MINESTELDIVEWFKDLASLEAIMKFFSQLGNPLVFVLLVALLFWCVDSGLGQRMALFTFAAGSINEVLKRAFSAPRAFWVSSDVRSIGEGSTAFDMPSGRSVGALAWLIIPLWLRRTWLWIVFGVVAAMDWQTPRT
jgi:hypothetical protein